MEEMPEIGPGLGIVRVGPELVGEPAPIERRFIGHREPRQQKLDPRGIEAPRAALR